MKKISLDKCLFIYDEGKLVAAYEVKKTKSDIVKALNDYGCFDDCDEDDWEIGIGSAECHSLDEVAEKILNGGGFFDEDDEKFFGLDGAICPTR